MLNHRITFYSFFSKGYKPWMVRDGMECSFDVCAAYTKVELKCLHELYQWVAKQRHLLQRGCDILLSTCLKSGITPRLFLKAFLSEINVPILEVSVQFGL